MQNSNIEWTHRTWNPVTGCTKISPGCKHCYAANIAETRFKGEAAFPNGFDLVLHPERLAQVSPTQKPKMIFVNSMSDIFHEAVPEAYIRRICDAMMAASQHTYQILTKRHERMRALLSSPAFADVAKAEHIWWGVSAEDRKYGLPRVKTLLQAPVRNRFVSFEPLLEDVGEIDLTGLGWIIIGGESGPGARSFGLEWAESLIGQARRDRVPVFMKQIGAYPMLGCVRITKAKRDPKGKDMSGWPEHLRVREFPDGMMSTAAVEDDRDNHEETALIAAPANVISISEIRSAKPPVKDAVKLTPEEISWNMPIGAAMELFFEDTTPNDYELKNRVDEALSEAIDSVVGTPGLDARHLSMAVLDLARGLVMACLTRTGGGLARDGWREVGVLGQRLGVASTL